MFNLLKRIFGKTKPSIPEPGTAVDNEQLLEIERKLQEQRLDLAEKDKSIAQLKEDLERERYKIKTQVSNAVEIKMESLLTDVSTPVSQLLTQAYILEKEGKPVHAKDVLIVARRIISTFEDNGLSIEGKVGEQVSFNANLHEPLSSEDSLAEGQSVTVRFVGIGYNGKIIRKTRVVKTGDWQCQEK